MKKIVIGVDPDSKKHGVSIYEDRKLAKLESCSLPDLMILLYELNNLYPYCQAKKEVHIENVNGVSAAFRARDKEKLNIHRRLSMAQDIGRCKHAQVEVERMAEYFGIKVVHHKISKKWKDPSAGKAQFQQLTGWTGRSNEDTRSAAWFGYIGSR